MNELLGPLAALALALLGLSLFFTGKILPRNTVRREDLDAALKIIADYTEGLKILTTSMDRLIETVELIQRNNGRQRNGQEKAPQGG